MYKKMGVLFISVFLLLVLGLGCDPQSINTIKEGDLTVSFGTGKGVSSLWIPSIDMDIASYELSGEGPEGRAFSGVTSEGESVTVSDLRMGSWIITATGLNSEGEKIGEGASVATVEAGMTVSTSILVEEYTGEGTFSFTSDWPSSDVQDPHMKLTFTKLGSTDSQVFDCIINTETGMAMFSGQLSVGYYSLQIGLYEGSSADIDNKLVGTSHAVRIVANNTTEGNYIITQEDLNVTGNLKVQVSNGIANPFVVTLSSSAELVGEGQSVTLTATTTPFVEGFYTWYLDGELIENETQSELVIGSTLSLGNHSIDLLVAASSVLSSASTTLKVIEYVPGYMNFVFTSLEDSSKTYEISFESGVVGDLSQMGLSQEGEGIPLATRLDSPSGFYYGTIFVATKVPLSFDEALFSSDNCAVQLLIPQEEVGNYSAPVEDGDGESIMNPYFEIMLTETDSSGNEQIIIHGMPTNISIAITAYSSVGGMITGSIDVDSLELYSYAYEIDDRISLGNYKMEGTFSVKRINDLVFYILSYDGNGATSGACPEACEKLPMDDGCSSNHGNGELGPLSKEGYTFGGWNTKSDGTGITYNDDDDENSSFIMPSENATLYAVWIPEV
jgi:uncharacterized repeat protein (TIGR02543 family)